MKYCQDHWDALRKGVADRGMEHLGAQTGEEAVEHLAHQAEQGEEVFDPLMGAHWRIANRVLGNIGANDPAMAFACLGDPAWCPLCCVQESYQWWDDPAKNVKQEPRPEHAADAQGWIDQTLDGALVYARSQGLLGPLN